MKGKNDSTWESDPGGTFRKMMTMIAQDEKHGYLTSGEAARLRKKAHYLYRKGKAATKS